ncbi:hypothetical protein EVAR_91401_1 [Eumeta japonica]|uniref:Uncharacterized protein n=1 Tax=Eumeta variegata TaxID=151549 RepID=A0A4C1X9B5_EUMVA|nr:hypothetical protein EVAR_91401_1 [Eumeta japonica]
MVFTEIRPETHAARVRAAALRAPRAPRAYRLIGASLAARPHMRQRLVFYLLPCTVIVCSVGLSLDAACS